MKSIALKRLNFQVLFDFPQHYPPDNLPARHRYNPPRSCGSFCVDCEEKGLCSSRYPYRMSHGADTEDFEQALGISIPPHPTNGKFIDTPVMFLGIEPGGAYDNDQLLSHPVLRKLSKWVPTKHYYWTPQPDAGLPLEPVNVTSVPGPFFTYLIYKFGLRNAYFTNIVKCRLWDAQRIDKYGQPSSGEVDIKPDKSHLLADSRIRSNCIEKYLKQEVMIHQPKVIFVLGSRGMEILKDERAIDQNLLVTLFHYSYVNRNQMNAEQYSKQCEQTIYEELVKRQIT